MLRGILSGIVVLSLTFASVVFGADERDIGKLPDYLQKTNVAIKVDGRQVGSGSAITKKVGNENVSFIVTAAHVVDSLRKTRVVIDPSTGTNRTVVEFNDAQLVQELRENNRRVGEINVDAEVIRYSNADTGEDIAILQVRKKNYFDTSMVFHLEDNPPPLATPLFHCGSPLGQIGTNSVTTGILSQVGRVYQNKVYDQADCAIFGGSSGGAVVVSDRNSEHFGEYIGMIVRGVDGGFSLLVPMRRMSEWSKKVGVEFLFNPALPVPSLEDLRKTPVEDVGATFKGNDAKEAAKQEEKANAREIFVTPTIKFLNF
jgi:hypothetical protein